MNNYLHRRDWFVSIKVQRFVLWNTITCGVQWKGSSHINVKTFFICISTPFISCTVILHFTTLLSLLNSGAAAMVGGRMINDRQNFIRRSTGRLMLLHLIIAPRNYSPFQQDWWYSYWKFYQRIATIPHVHFCPEWWSSSVEVWLFCWICIKW